MNAFRLLSIKLCVAAILGLPVAVIVIASVPLEYRGLVALRFSMSYGLIAFCVSLWLVMRAERRFNADLTIASWVHAFSNGDLSSRLHPNIGGEDQAQLVHNLNALQESMRNRIEQLQDDRRRSFMVLAHMVEGIIAIQEDGRVMLINEAARKFLKLTSDNMVGRQLLEVIRVPEVRMLVNRTLATNTDSETEILSSDARHLLIKAGTLPSQSRRGVLLTIHDQTQLKQLETMRREFIANVSHELKTPLAAVKGYAETLQLGALDDKETAPHFVNQILAQSDRLERLIADMMQLARAQDRSHRREPVDVLVLPVVRECCDTYQPVAAQKNIELQMQPIDETATVLGEREALLSVMNNLVGNALRYTQPGGHVSIRCQPEGNSMVISVTDDGAGIPQKDQERIFERFYRVEKARDLQHGGTGLGLAIVKNIVESFGGSMRLRSEPGKGSTFQAVLPT